MNDLVMASGDGTDGLLLIVDAVDAITQTELDGEMRALAVADKEREIFVAQDGFVNRFVIVNDAATSFDALPFAAPAIEMVAADVDQDDLTDLVVATSADDPTIAVLRRSAAGDFVGAEVIELPFAVRAIAVGNVAVDFAALIVVVNDNGIIGTIDPETGDVATDPVVGCADPTHVALGLIDTDVVAEVVVSCAAEQVVEVWFGPLGSTSPARFPVTAPRGIAVADVDGDGRADIIVGGDDGVRLLLQRDP